MKSLGNYGGKYSNHQKIWAGQSLTLRLGLLRENSYPMKKIEMKNKIVIPRKLFRSCYRSIDGKNGHAHNVEAWYKRLHLILLNSKVANFQDTIFWSQPRSRETFSSHSNFEFLEDPTDLLPKVGAEIFVCLRVVKIKTNIFF